MVREVAEDTAEQTHTVSGEQAVYAVLGEQAVYAVLGEQAVYAVKANSGRGQRHKGALRAQSIMCMCDETG